jgi:MFS family permease
MFTMAGVFFTISTIGCWVVREPIRPVLDEPESIRELVSGGATLLREHREFRSLAVVTFLAFGLNLTMPFYILYAKAHLGVPDEMAGIYIWAAVLSGGPIGLLWGRVNDRRGPRTVLRGGCIMATLAPALAILIPWAARAASAVFPGAPGAVPYLYALVFLVGGSSFGPLWMGSNNYLFELASHEDRHRYIALLATLTAPRTLFPLLTGAVLAVVRFEIVFAVLVALGVATIVVSWRLKRPEATGSAGPA